MTPSSKKQKILIIDDTPANIQLINEILRDNYRIYFATTGAEGLEIAARELPDLILLDIMMPGMDGYQICARLKGAEATRRIPVIFVTAMGSIEDEARGLEAGAIDYLTKPISPPIVKIRVDNHLELKRYSDELESLSKELARKNEQLELLARQDFLTGLANRRRFNEAMDIEIRRANRHGEIFSLIMGDIDFFKRYNDYYGHLAGDKCLQMVGETMLKLFRRGDDLPARYGGEEFAVLLPGTADDTALRLAESLRLEIAARAMPHACSDAADCVTLSLGVVTARVIAGRTPEWFTARADEALYRAKDEGRNRVSSIIAD